MNSKKYLFYDKMQCIYNSICKQDLESFTKLFYIKSNKASFENRKTYLRKNWIKKQDKTLNPRMFKSEYFRYPFSQLAINGRRLFDDGEEFLQTEVEQFSQRIKNYVALQGEVEIDKNNHYHYLYVYNINGVEENPNIDYYQIEYGDSTTPNEITIEIQPPKHKSSLVIEPYHGKLKYQSSKIILSFENSDDYISAIFNTDLMNNHTKYLVGIGVGIADINQKIPIAKKVILSKEKIRDIDTIYPILNETEIVSAQENGYELKYDNRDFDLNHLGKYIEKINRVDILFDKLSKQQKYGSFYKQLAFKEFSATTNILKKIVKNQPYYVNHRKRVVDILLKSYPYEKYQKIYIVMPTYYDDNLFAQQSPKALQLQNELLALSDRVEIEIIFVIKNCQEPLIYEFKKFLSKVKEQIKFRFAFINQIEKEVNSIDFIFTDNYNFVITKFLRVNNPVFNLYEDKSTIDEIQAIYRKIFNRSVDYDTFVNEQYRPCIHNNPIVEKLMGEWYVYAYGSQNFHEDRLVIFQDGTVEYYYKDKKTESGKIINYKYQSIILLEDMVTKRLFTITFDHEEYKITKAFTIKIVAKKYKSDADIFTLGLISREAIKTEKVCEILGDIDNVRILGDGSVGSRLSDYLRD